MNIPLLPLTTMRRAATPALSKIPQTRTDLTNTLTGNEHSTAQHGWNESDKRVQAPRRKRRKSHTSPPPPIRRQC